MNRIENAIARTKSQIFERITSGQLKDPDALSKKLDMTFNEWSSFQTLKSSVTGSRLSAEEAMTVYEYLGHNREHFNAQPLEVKVTLTQLFAELLAR